MSFQISNEDIRQNFRVAAGMIADANNVDVKKIDLSQLTQGYLNTQTTLTVNQQTLQFPIVDTQQVNNAPITPLMRLLSMQDSFVVGSLSFYLMYYQFTGGNEQNPDFTARPFIPITGPNPFAAGGAVVPQFLNTGAMSMFWNSYLYFEVDKKVLIPFWDTQRHLKIPRTQATPAGPNFPEDNWQPNVLNDYDGSTDGYYPVEPTIVLGGGRQNIVKMFLPANIPSTVSPFNVSGYGTTFNIKACIQFRGILAQNSTSVK